MKTGSEQQRLKFLCRIVQKEMTSLQDTNQRLFSTESIKVELVSAWVADPVMSERLDAFVARFSRLQDTLGDKLIPALLEHLGEQAGPAIDNLNKAEKFGWIESAEQWLLYRRLRNQMIHEYIEDNEVLTNALKAGQSFVPTMLRIAARLVRETEFRVS